MPLFSDGLGLQRPKSEIGSSYIFGEIVYCGHITDVVNPIRASRESSLNCPAIELKPFIELFQSSMSSDFKSV